jgi:DNA-binding winged helix-turn-helix (wHTH) protein
VDARSDLDFDPTTGELRGPAGAVRLAPQSAQALGLLLEAEGELVSREVLLEAIWPGERFGVSERLTYCIHQLREVLDGVGLAGVIETLPRRGYRMAVPAPTAVRPDGSIPLRFPAAWPALVGPLLLVLLIGLAPRWSGGSQPGDSHLQHAARHAARH